MKRKYRWTLLIYDSLVYLASALLILIIYPSSIDKLTPALIVSHTIMGLVCLIVTRSLIIPVR